MGQTSPIIGQASQRPVKNYVNFSYFSRVLEKCLFWGHDEVSTDLNGQIMWKTLVWIELAMFNFNSKSNSMRKPEKPNPSILVLHPVVIRKNKIGIFLQTCKIEVKSWFHVKKTLSSFHQTCQIYILIFSEKIKIFSLSTFFLPIF